nr:transporter suffix domain-containing protein [uncultured Chryseobacterium sp.]
MSKEKPYLKSKPELILLGLGTLCLIGVPILSLLDFPNKAATILVILISGEVLFLITIALSGKGYIGKMKVFLLQFLPLKNKKRQE